MNPATQREKDWHNRRFADGGDARAGSRVNIAYTACVYAQNIFTGLQNATGKRVLDIGCGRGVERAEKFTSQGCEYTGIDISEECISANLSDSARIGLKCSFSCDDANTLLSLGDQKYDLVILSGTLHHLELDKALPTLSRVAAKNGRVIMWEPMGTNPVLSLFRQLTPNLRTPDEHPLNYKDLKAVQNYFPCCKFQFHVITALAVIPLAMVPSRRIRRLARSIGLTLGRLDAILGQIPIVRRLHWVVVIIAEN